MGCLAIPLFSFLEELASVLASEGLATDAPKSREDLARLAAFLVAFLFALRLRGVSCGDYTVDGEGREDAGTGCPPSHSLDFWRN